MGSETRVRIEGIADFEVSGYAEENISTMKQILKYAYISSGAQDSCISNTFNGLNQLAFNLMKLYQEASETKSDMKHNNGENIPFSNSIYMYPVDTLGSIDWLIYEGDDIPMAGFSHSSNIKWHREITLHNAKSIKMKYTESSYSEDLDEESTEEKIFDSIGNLLEFKKFFYKRWNELHCATELDMKKKFTCCIDDSFPVDMNTTIKNSIKNSAVKFALSCLMVSKHYIEKDILNSATIYDNGTHFAIRVHYDKRASHLSYHKRIKMFHTDGTIKFLMNKLSDRRGKTPHINTKDKIIGKINKDQSFWIIVKKHQLTDKKIRYIIKKLFNS